MACSFENIISDNCACGRIVDISSGISDVHDSVSWLPGKEIATGCYVNTTIDETKRHTLNQ